MKLEYNVTQIKKTAKFLWKKNPWMRTTRQSHEIEASIIKTLKKYAREVKRNIEIGDIWWPMSTEGYTIIIFQEGDKLLSAEVLVDAGVAEADYTRIDL